jgi:hypothetical protein
MAEREVLERVFEAALDQPAPSRELTQALNQAATYLRHRDRDKKRDPHQGMIRHGPPPRPYPEPLE